MKIALVWHGNREARDTAQARFSEHRLFPTAEAFRAEGFQVEPCVYNDDFADEVREQLGAVDAVQVWVNPITEDGRTRAKLDSVLRSVAEGGVFVSSHPDRIRKMGTKDVLYATRDMEWGSDVRRYETLNELRQGLPQSLLEGPRVLKQHRGHSGQGVWKVSPTKDRSRVLAKHAVRGSEEQEVPLANWIESCAVYFEAGPMVDQAYNPAIERGTVRCYMVQARIEGFGLQEVNALVPGAEPGPRLYFGPDREDLQDLKRKVEEEWLPQLMTATDVGPDELPMLWDIDLMYREGGGHSLCEINVSSVYPYPESAMRPLARAFKSRMAMSSS